MTLRNAAPTVVAAFPPGAGGAVRVLLRFKDPYEPRATSNSPYPRDGL